MAEQTRLVCPAVAPCSASLCCSFCCSRNAAYPLVVTYRASTGWDRQRRQPAGHRADVPQRRRRRRGDGVVLISTCCSSISRIAVLVQRCSAIVEHPAMHGPGRLHQLGLCHIGVPQRQGAAAPDGGPLLGVRDEGFSREAQGRLRGRVLEPADGRAAGLGRAARRLPRAKRHQVERHKVVRPTVVTLLASKQCCSQSAGFLHCSAPAMPAVRLQCPETCRCSRHCSTSIYGCRASACSHQLHIMSGP
jgi:hypothetical protein